MIIQGDCLLKLKELDDNSVDSIVTDPPYGLEFMGKEWDKFATGRGAKYKKGGEINKVSIPGTGFTKLPGYIQRPAKRCKICGKQAWSGSPCKCEKPEWELDNSVLLSFQEFNYLWAKECLRVLKPGGHLLAFSGTRTYHRMACAIEDAGFEVRDMIEWCYGSGFPKSHNIGLRLDQKLGLQGFRGKETSFSAKVIQQKYKDGRDKVLENGKEIEKYEGKSEIAKQYQGWGTALKPAHEPICMARKPLSEKTVAENCLKWGTGGINIDESRVGTEVITQNQYDRTPEHGNKYGNGAERKQNGIQTQTIGRFPANLLHDNSEEVRECFPETKSVSGGRSTGRNFGQGENEGGKDLPRTGHDDSGNASRFFKSILYYPKASKSERNKGCEDIPEKRVNYMAKANGTGEPSMDTFSSMNRNNHPTVKPIALMEYLIKMVTPKGGTVLDPFAGSGSTLVAAKQNGYKYIGIELTPEYIPIIEARLNASIIQQKLL